MFITKFGLPLGRGWFVLCLCFTVVGINWAQSGDRATTPRDAEPNLVSSYSPVRVVSLSAATTLILFELHESYVHSWWWKDRRSFHFAYDGDYACNMDKLGHAVAWNFVAEGYRTAYRWAGWDDEAACWWALGTAAGLHLFTESHEGLSSYFGFDPLDYASGMAGASLVVGQHYWPWLRRVQLRLSFVPSRSYDEYHPAIKDYQGQKYWAGVTLFPEKSTSFLRGVTLDVGFNLNDYDATVAQVHPQLWISLGIDWRRYLGESILARLLNYLKFSFPAVRVAPQLGMSWTSWD